MGTTYCTDFTLFLGLDESSPRDTDAIYVANTGPFLALFFPAWCCNTPGMDNIAQLILILLFGGFLYFIAKAPADGLKVFIGLMWVLFILGGIGSFIYTVVTNI